MKKRLLILMTVTGMLILLGGLLTYGLVVHEIIPVPRPDLIVVGTSLIGILLIVSGVCDLCRNLELHLTRQIHGIMCMQSSI